MKTIILISVTGILIAIAGCTSDKKDQPANKFDYAKYVDPFIGTAGQGHTFPGATLPFGMVQVSPDNGKEGWDWCSGYHYSSDTIAGFSHLHLSGTGAGDMLDILVLPTNQKLKPDNVNTGNSFMHKYRSTFSHQEEIASPGYYKVRLKSSGIYAEMSASMRAAIHRYTFPESSISTIILDLFHSYNLDECVETHIKVINHKSISGYRISNGFCPVQKVYFAIEFSKPFYNVVFVDDVGNIVDNVKEMTGKGIRAGFEYSTDEGETILLKVGISSVSETAAANNKNKEIPNWNFDFMVSNARRIWNHELSKIKVTSDNIAELKTFYTALYHCMLAPQLLSDADGQYRGVDGKVHFANGFHYYSTLSLWDTFRGENPLFTLLFPDLVREIVKSMMSHYEQYGVLPKWALWGGETNCMIGYHSIPVIIDAYFKGLLNSFDAPILYDAIKKTAMASENDLQEYIKNGYLPEDYMRNKYYSGKQGKTESASKTLEWAYDDWCVAQMANALDKKEDYEYFLSRSKNFVNIFDTAIGYMRPKNMDGSWVKPFDPVSTDLNNGFTEACSWQYSWFAPQNITRLIDLRGGRESVDQRLDSLFNTKLLPGDNTPADVTGLLGQYAHGNEPCHHIAYLYNYISKPWKTQRAVDWIMDSLYNSTPSGLCGNDDCGQMSAWYVLSSMGFYPVNPASGIFDIGSPRFSKVELSLDNGKTFEIIAPNVSESNYYIQSIFLNEELLDGYRISYMDIIKGGSLEFTMDSQPYVKGE